MKPLDALAMKFEGLSPRAKASLIASVCGVFGVVCGMVIYIVFAHLFEQGEAEGKLIGVVTGILISIVIAWFADRLWDTIDEGRFSSHDRKRRTVIAVVSLVIVFELSASAFEDFARAFWSDRAALMRIAGDIAGRDADAAQYWGSRLNYDALHKLMYMELRKAVAVPRFGEDCVECARSPVLRIYQFLPTSERYLAFPQFERPTDQQLYDALIVPIPSNSPWLTMGTPNYCSNLVVHGLYANADIRLPLTAACRSLIMDTSERDRSWRLAEAVANVLLRPDFYHAEHFERAANGAPLELPEKLRERLEAQRKNCNAISASAGQNWTRGCVAAIREGNALPGSGVLAPPRDIRALNWSLLVSAFGTDYVQPLPADWWDFATLLAVWSAAAMMLGLILTRFVFRETMTANPRSVLRRLFFALAAIASAAIVAGVVLALARSIPFLWDLMFDSSAPRLKFSAAAFLPWLVHTLANGEAGISVPGWMTLPVIFCVAGAIWFAAWRRPWSWAWWSAKWLIALLLATLVFPVFDGIFTIVWTIAGAWIVPAFGLIFLAPYLTRSASLPQWWGAIALAAGLAVAVWVGVVLSETDIVYRILLALAGLLAALTGALILRRIPVGDLWPLLAVTAGLTFVGGAAFQHLSFAGALNLFRPVSTAPVGERECDGYDRAFGVAPCAEVSASETFPAPFLAPPDAHARDENVRLELALTGSIGFWLTIATLAAWSLKAGPRE